jgi:hypothetical protein
MRLRSLALCAASSLAIVAQGQALAHAYAHAHAPTSALAQASSDAVAALEAARADAKREFSTAPAALTAYQRIERLREPLLASGDPRAAIWYADATEDAIVIGLPADQSGIDALVGLRSAAARERTVALLRQALAWVQRADECVRDELALNTVSPQVAERLATIEQGRRIPLLRAASAILAARAGALPVDDVQPVVTAALTRLESLKPVLEGPALALANLAIGVGAAQVGRTAEAQAALAAIAADSKADAGARIIAMVLLAETSSNAVADRRRTLASLTTRFGGELDDRGRLLLGDADFRLATEANVPATSPTPPWQGWLDAIAATPAARRSAVRAAVLDRIATNIPDASDPVATLARALHDARVPETRERAATAMAEALASGKLSKDLRALAEFELARNELLLGRALDGATRMLRFAQEYPADPASRHAIDVAVLAARALGDPALLTTVLVTAVERFPDHADHGAWRIEAAALALSPDADLLKEREPPARRYARAIEALDRAHSARSLDPAIMADLAIAAAQAANEMGLSADALAVLDRVATMLGSNATSGGVGIATPLPPDLRTRLLEERILALALAARSIDADPWVRSEQEASAESAANACVRVVHRQVPMGLAAGLIEPLSAESKGRVVRLADAGLRLASPSPDRDDVLVCAFLLGDRPDAALPIARRVVVARGERVDSLLALAEALMASGDQASLAEAMQIYTRLSHSCTEGSPAWWISELRRLQVLDRVNRNVDVIGPRIARLQSAHPELGGPALQASFLALAARHR